MDNEQSISTWWTLKVTLGLVAFLTGLDKFFNVLTRWIDYVSPAVVDAFHLGPISLQLFLRGTGILEMLLGFAILTRWTKPGGYLTALWLTAFAVNLVIMGKFYDVALYYLALSLAAFTLGRWTEVRRVVRVTTTDARRAVDADAGLLRLNL